MAIKVDNTSSFFRDENIKKIANILGILLNEMRSQLFGTTVYIKGTKNEFKRIRFFGM